MQRFMHRESSSPKPEDILRTSVPQSSCLNHISVQADLFAGGQCSASCGARKSIVFSRTILLHSLATSHKSNDILRARILQTVCHNHIFDQPVLFAGGGRAFMQRSMHQAKVNSLLKDSNTPESGDIYGQLFFKPHVLTISLTSLSSVQEEGGSLCSG
jgi:hypothetical protein